MSFYFYVCPIINYVSPRGEKKGISPHNILTCYERPFQGVQLKEEIKITARKPSIWLKNKFSKQRGANSWENINIEILGVKELSS